LRLSLGPLSPQLCLPLILPMYDKCFPAFPFCKPLPDILFSSPYYLFKPSPDFSLTENPQGLFPFHTVPPLPVSSLFPMPLSPSRALSEFSFLHPCWRPCISFCFFLLLLRQCRSSSFLIFASTSYRPDSSWASSSSDTRHRSFCFDPFLHTVYVRCGSL